MSAGGAYPPPDPLDGGGGDAPPSFPSPPCNAQLKDNRAVCKMSLGAGVVICRYWRTGYYRKCSLELIEGGQMDNPIPLVLFSPNVYTRGFSHLWWNAVGRSSNAKLVKFSYTMSPGMKFTLSNCKMNGGEMELD